MMHGLEDNFFPVNAFKSVLDQTTGCIWMTDHGIDFIECEPVSDAITITINDRTCEVHEEIDCLSVVPAIVFQAQM